ncbi:hypothetical protein T05_289 [Trichinella murrelli]|uniref:6-Cys domain-containing protein n=1 Tax=Trichinella murrelli TaxID=144512 RepID=A0A0V0TNJ8_9BILA|nr:hypothetical protein T05_289 [Trichinella murrelli]
MTGSQSNSSPQLMANVCRTFQNSTPIHFVLSQLENTRLQKFTTKRTMKFEISFLLYFATVVRILYASFNCPYENRNNETFGLEIPMNGSKHSRLCLTWVDKNADNVNKTKKTTILDDIFASENYCKANYKNGRMSNYESIMIYANKRKKTLNYGSIVRLLTSDQYVIKSFENCCDKNVTLLKINHTSENVLGRITETEYCLFDWNVPIQNCNALYNIEHESIQWALSHTEEKFFCQITTFRKRKNSIQELKSKLIDCADDSQWDGYFCIHEPYQNCKFYSRTIPCRFQHISNNSDETKCIEELRYFYETAPEMPYGKSCPENEMYPCNCSNAMHLSEREIDNLLKMMEASVGDEMDFTLLLINLYNNFAWLIIFIAVFVMIYKKFFCQCEEAPSTTSSYYDESYRIYPIRQSMFKIKRVKLYKCKSINES